MVRKLKLIRFARNEDGVALVEGLVVFPLVLLAFSAFFEFSYAVYQWNQTVKAVQYGARMLAVSEPLLDLTVSGGKTYLEVFADQFDDDYTGTATNPVPAAIVAKSCGAGTTACNTDKINRLVYGATSSGINDACGDRLSNTIPGMCDINPRIDVSNVLVTYYRDGLGYEGRPDGPVLTIRLEVAGLNFDLPLVGALLNLNQFTIPAQPVTITSEDLCSKRSC
jgi:Flp pilus assembly protein TadG